MNDTRSYMYRRLENGFITNDFFNGVEEFVNFAKMHPEIMCGETMCCPCNHRKCRNRAYHDEDVVKLHLCRYGFVPNYYRWHHHGETYITSEVEHWVGPSSSTQVEHVDHMQNMVHDIYNSINIEDEPQSPNETAKNLYEMLRASETEIWEGNPNGHSQLSVVARLLNMKAEHHISERCYNDMCQLISELLPTENCMTNSFYDTKKLIKGLGLPVEKIDYCSNNCMIYWRDDFDLQECRFCGHPRYKPTLRRAVKKKYVPWKRMYYFPLTPRLQRLYTSVEMANHMRWHSDHVQDGDTMCHPSDSPAWKHFDITHPDFASEVPNVRLGHLADGFQPFGQLGQQYSSWPVILTPYNLPPWMCMKDEYMFLTVIAPGPSNPKDKLNVFLQPLIAELNELWSVGATTYDVHLKTNFTMRASLLWTISDFPAYAMLSGWSTAGKLACPYCMEDSDAFTLPNGGKTSWFDNHRKFLPIDHNFRRNIKWFKKNHQVKKPPPHIKSGDEIIEELESYGFRSVTELEATEVNSEIVKLCKCGWRRRSIFWKLPYWRTNLIRHNLDVMHIEKCFREHF